MATKKILYIALAAMLLLCLAPMPYGYFMLVRFVMLVTCGWLAVDCFQKGRQELAWTFGALALLFQPIVKIALGRTIWNVVDVAVAILFVVLLLKDRDKQP